MIIQIFLSAILAGIALLVTLQRTTSGVVRVGILAVIGAGAVFVWAPDYTSVIAEAIGVGRGADLVLYLWVVITLALILILYLQVIRMGRRITQLTRAIALAHARAPETTGRD
jgi:small membrane protein